MRIYKSKRGLAIFQLAIFLVFVEAILIFLLNIVDGYLERNLLFLVMITYAVWCLYYLFLDMSLKYIVLDDKIIIYSLLGLKKVIINFDEINGFLVKENYINGFKLAGMGKNKFAFGRLVVDKVGITRAFISNAKSVIYVHTENLAYGISPIDTQGFVQMLLDRKVPIKEFETKTNNNKELFKDKKFIVPFIVSTVIIAVVTILPFVLYLFNSLPEKMPLNFDAYFSVVLWGSGKQFAFKQMIYGICNMIILVCMYYTSYFTARFDKKLAVRYLYIPLFISFIFLVIQIQILFKYL